MLSCPWNGSGPFRMPSMFILLGLKPWRSADPLELEVLSMSM